MQDHEQHRIHKTMERSKGMSVIPASTYREDVSLLLEALEDKQPKAYAVPKDKQLPKDVKAPRATSRTA